MVPVSNSCSWELYRHLDKPAVGICKGQSRADERDEFLNPSVQRELLGLKVHLLLDLSNINFIEVFSTSLRSSMWSPTNSSSYSSVEVKGKQSHYRPGQAQNVLRKLRFPDFVTTAQDGGRLSPLRTGRFYPPGNTPGTHFF